MTEQLSKTYDPVAVERDVIARWDAAHAWHADPRETTDNGKPPFSIVIPPPNVTAALHLGHALNNTLQDVLIRFHRMTGHNACWLPGTDHAGIATQTVVDRRLQAEGKPSLKDYKQQEEACGGGRDAFIDKVQTWKDEYEARITDQLKQMGCSCDWDRQRFTMDDVCAAAVREAFFQLFKDGLIYRGKRLVNWDPVTQTALADDEVEMHDVDGNFWYMKYPLCDEHGEPTSVGGHTHVAVATTRPETMLGDTAVAVNPKDPERAQFAGNYVRLPIVGRVIPIIADDYVVIPKADSTDAKEKYASGFLKVTPAHDPNDYEIGQRHDLPMINVMAPDASISKDHGWPAAEWQTAAGEPASAGGRSAGVPENPSQSPGMHPFATELLGQSREDARRSIIQWFKDHDLLEETRPYRHAVGHSYRSHVPIEPYLSDQWYVAVKKPTKRLGNDDSPVEGTEVPKNSLAGAALRALERTPEAPHENAGLPSRLTFTPDRYEKTFRGWHENIRDWCISRQLWWGHRIPVWRIACGESHPWSHGDPVRDFTKESLEKLQSRVAAYLDACGEKGNYAFYPHDGRDFAVRVCTRTSTGDDAINAFFDFHKGVELKENRPGEEAQYATLNVPGFEQASSEANELFESVMSYDHDAVKRDPDVLDTWFSSALWPLSTMGWPTPGRFPEEIPEGDDLLNAFNPTSVLCTARDIITLWVSRMVMFNAYFLSDAGGNAAAQSPRMESVGFSSRRGELPLPFQDVYIHPMIQDGAGQRMSKSLGNGVDPMDIIHSHGADAMRFTLASMATQTQDARLPVDCVDPHTGEAFEPETVTLPNGAKVAAPIQERNGRKMVTSYGYSSGKAVPSEPGGEMPLARNTSEKFDLGQRLCNKLWNACRFAFGYLEGAEGERRARFSGRADDPETKPTPQDLPSRWILSRLARTVSQCETAIGEYRFSDYAATVYDFFWRDLCDWYIEAVKPTLRDDAAQQGVLTACLDATLRMMHPAMPFITERVWETLREIAGDRGTPGVELAGSPDGLLMTAAWPRVDASLADAEAEARFEAIRESLTALREARNTHKIKPQVKVTVSIRTDADTAGVIESNRRMFERLGNIEIAEVGEDVLQPAGSAAAMSRDVAIYLHDVVDTDTERQRLTKRMEEIEKSIKQLEGRLSNEKYVSKAPAHLVQETRDQLAETKKEAEQIEQQLAALA
jgi:valyl-tRNA synthetase